MKYNVTYFALVTMLLVVTSCGGGGSSAKGPMAADPLECNNIFEGNVFFTDNLYISKKFLSRI